MAWSRRLVSAAALLAAVTCAPLAVAQTPEERASARVLVQQADKKLDEKDFQAAIDLFAKAYLVVPAPTIRLAQARAEIQMGRLIAAQQHMLEAAHSPAQAGQPASWATAHKDAANEASALNARFASLELSIAPASVAPIVTIDGQSVAPSTLSAPRALDPGAHAVHVEASGFPHDRSERDAARR